MKKTILMYCFSGTGNAFHIAQIASKSFERHGYRVIFSGIDQIHPEHENAELIGFFSSIYGFGLPYSMVKFLKKIPSGNGKKAIAFLSVGNTEYITFFRKKIAIPPTAGWGIDQTCWMLKSKGYKIQNAYSVEMPNNWILISNPPDKEQVADLFSNCDEKLNGYVEEVVGGFRNIQKVPMFWCYLMFPIYCIFLLFSRRVLGKFFTVDMRKCTSCKQCFEKCPSHTIQWSFNKPYWGWNCEQCFRCINLCPTKAIEVSNWTLLLSFLYFFWLDLPSQLLILSSIEDTHPSLKFIFNNFVWLFVLWLIHFIQIFPFSSELIPRWYTTANRRRYFEPGFKEFLAKKGN